MRKTGGYPSRLPSGGYRLNVESPLAKGLVFWCPLIDRNPNDRIVGLAATPTAAPVMGNSSEGLAWAFVRASSQYLVTASTPVTAPPITMACWYNAVAVASTRGLMSICNSGNITDFFQLQVAGGAGARARQGDATSTSNATSTNNASAGVWQLAVAVFLSTTSRSAFLNGTGKATSTASRTPSGCNAIGIGATVSSTPVDFFDGQIRNAMIWNRALSDAEVWMLYQLGSRWDMFDAAMWNGAATSAPVAANPMSRGNVRPVSRPGLPIQYLRI